MQTEIQQLQAGALKQYLRHTVQADATDRGTRPIEIQGNSLVLVPKWKAADGTDLVSDLNTRVWIKFNHINNDWIPFSLIASGEDYQVFLGTIVKFWVRIEVPGAAGAQLHFVIMRGVGIASATGGVIATGSYMVSGSTVAVGSTNYSNQNNGRFVL